jgi:hypothetical protein
MMQLKITPRNDAQQYRKYEPLYDFDRRYAQTAAAAAIPAGGLI